MKYASNTLACTLILFAFIFSFSVSSCKKDLGSRSYTMTTYDNSGISGTVEFKENKNGSTTIHVHMMGTSDGLSYPAHIHNGSISSPGTIAIDLSPLVSSGGMAEMTKEVSNKYDDMVDFDGCFVAHNPQSVDPLTSYVLVGNIGKNAN